MIIASLTKKEAAVAETFLLQLIYISRRLPLSALHFHQKYFSSFRPHAHHHHNHALPPPPPLHPYHLYPCPQVEQEQNYYLRVERGAFSFMKQSSLCRRQN